MFGNSVVRRDIAEVCIESILSRISGSTEHDECGCRPCDGPIESGGGIARGR